MRSSSRTTVTRTTTVTRAPAAPAAAVPVAVPPPANDAALPADSALPAEPVDAVPAVPADPAAVAEPTEPRPIAGTVGLLALGALALIIALLAWLFLRRRSPVATRVVETPAVTETLADPPAPAPAAAPVFSSAAAIAPTAIRQRDTAPVRGALPSAGASVDLPATLPESYEERTALFDKMVSAKPDKANPFTDRRQRMHRARLIMQSLGRTFDREPRIDLSQYPNNWPELQRAYHKAA